ncbi:preprotein translocase subunit YajC [Pseudonocardia alni]|nr:preprotein translocase subunit YajC [Pseudonocardia alni]NWJ70177.1 preprotein translocase subunit YajC [Pseudonocardia pini]WFG46963.1 preprotein translocase subunit YajC [Pseudonocardia alni]
MLPFLIILLLFVPLFLNGRKQRRQMAETQAMQQALEDGDVVVTTSGLRGTIVDASYEDTIDLEIADGVVTTWLRAAIREKVATDEATEETVAEPADKDASENKPTIH